MFCHKCGNQLPEDSGFCHKCGTKLTSDDTLQQAGAPESIEPIQPQAHYIQADKPKKKKSKKLLIGLSAIIGLFLIVIIIAANSGDLHEAGEQAKRDDEYIASQQQAVSFDLTKTYTDEDEWLSFQHPREWSENWTHLLKEYYDTDEVLDNRIIMLENSELGNPDDQFASYISVFRTPHYGYEHEIDAIFNATKENFPENVNVNATIESITDTTLDGAQTRIVEYSMPIPNTDNVAWYKRYYYAVESKLYRVDFLCLEKYWDRYEPTFDAIMDTYKITSAMKRTAPDSSESGTANLNQGEVLYEGIPLFRFFESSIDEVVDALGTPAGRDEYKLIYDNIEFGLYDGEITTAESFIPVRFEVDGVTLDKSRAELIALLGNPSSEGEGGGGYELTFERAGYMFTIETGDTDGAAWRISFWRNYGDDGPDDGAYGYEGDNDGGYESAFNRSDYLTGISYTDLMRYPDTHAYSKVYFENMEIKQVYEPKLYSVQGILDNKYYIIDDRGSINANGLVGDVIAGYGAFYGIETVNWDNGRSDQVPFITADRLIFKRDTPTDYDDFAKGLVTFMNIYKEALTYDNQYLGQAKVKINAYVWNTPSGIKGQFISNPNPSLPGVAAYVDGQLTQIDLSEPLTDYGLTIPDYDNKCLIWITGTIVSIDRVGLGNIKVTLEVEKIELIE